jgi:hypothetical protein
MKKIITSLLLLLLLQSCDKVYSLKERYTVEFQINDTNLNPLPNINIDLYPGDAPYFYYSNKDFSSNKGNIFSNDELDLISFGETNQNGHVVLHFPEPNRGLSVFSTFISDTENQYKSLKIAFNESDFDNNYLSAAGLKLYRLDDLVQLDIRTNLGENIRLLDYTLNGNIAYNELIYSDIEAVQIFTFGDGFDVQKNQNIILNYTLEEFTDTGIVTTNEEINLSINEDNLEYIIQNP